MGLVLIPAFEPDGELVSLCAGLRAEGFKVLVVNDGSGHMYNDVFAACADSAEIIHHEKNMGKGAALKTGLRYIRDNLPDCENIITADSDGQHTVADIIKVRERLRSGDKFVLTVRAFRRSETPLRSRFGNSLSKFVYALLTNRYLDDNQSGLRGFSREHIDWLIEVGKDNYDYEMNVLYIAARKNIRITTLPIKAIYIDNNCTSHFSPIKDTVRIYKSLFHLSGSTFIALLFAELLMLAVSLSLGYRNLFVTVPSVGAANLLIAYLFNGFFIKQKCNDHFVMLIYTVIKYFVYTLSCAIFVGGGVPLFISFNIIYLIFLPIRYYFHKFTAMASRPKE